MNLWNGNKDRESTLNFFQINLRILKPSRKKKSCKAISHSRNEFLLHTFSNGLKVIELIMIIVHVYAWI